MAASDEMESTRLETDAIAVVTELPAHTHTHAYTHALTAEEGQPCMHVSICARVCVCVCLNLNYSFQLTLQQRATLLMMRED